MASVSEVHAVIAAAYDAAGKPVSAAAFADACPVEGGVLTAMGPEDVDKLHAACVAAAGLDAAGRAQAVTAALNTAAEELGIATTSNRDNHDNHDAVATATASAPTSTGTSAAAATSSTQNINKDTKNTKNSGSSGGKHATATTTHAASAASAPTSTGAAKVAAAAAKTPVNGGAPPTKPAAKPAAPTASCTAVKVVVRHFSGLSYKELRAESTSDAQLVKEFEAFVAAKVAGTVNRSTAGATSMPLVREVRSRDTKGPFVFDPLHGLLRIEVVSADGAPLAVNRRFTLVGPPEHVREADRNASTTATSGPAAASADAAGGCGGLRVWVQQVMEANELGASEQRVQRVMRQLADDGIEELRHLLLVGDEYFARQGSAVMAAILSERNSIVAGGDSGSGGGTDGGFKKPKTAAQLAVIERANFHKVKRLIYSVTGHLSRLTLLDGGVIEDACAIINELYANPTVVALLKQDFLMPCAVPGGAMPRGLLLHGPPGTGKTMLVLLLCEYCGLMMVEPSMMSAGEINRGIVGETEKLLGEMFRRAHIMPYLPFIVAIDEIDSAVPKRDENSASNTSGADKVSVFLSNIQGGTDIPNLALVGASNRRECIDEAVRRRLEIQIYIGFLDVASRAQFLSRFLFDKTELDAPFQAVRDVAGPLYDLAVASSGSASSGTAAAAKNVEGLVAAAEAAGLVDAEADRGLLRSVAAQMLAAAAQGTKATKQQPRAEAVAAVERRICPVGVFFAGIEAPMNALTLNFSGAALKKLCSRLAASWDGHVRRDDKDGAGTAEVGEEGAAVPQTKTLPYRLLIDHMRQVSLADDIKVGTQLCYEVLSKTQRLFHPERLKKLFTTVLPRATGLIVVHLDAEGAAAGTAERAQSVLLQIEVFQAGTGALEVEEFEMRPHCPACDSYGAVHCAARGATAKHVFRNDGSRVGSGVVGKGSSEAEDRGVHTAAVQNGIRVDDVLGLLALIVAQRQLTKLELKNMTSFVAGGATDEKACIEDFLSTNKRARAPGSRTAVAVELDSTAGVTRNQSDGGMGSTSRSIGNRQLFSYACSSFGEYRCPFNTATDEGLGPADASGNSAGEALCVLIVQSKYVMDEFREQTKWPLTAHEAVAQQEEEERKQLQECARCLEQFSPAEQEDQEAGGTPATGCQYHAGRPAKRKVNAHGEVCLEQQPTEEHARSEMAKQTTMLEQPEPELPPGASDDEVKRARYQFRVRQNPWKSWRMVWTCCPEKAFDAPGCKRGGHSQEPKPASWRPSEAVKAMLAAGCR